MNVAVNLPSENATIAYSLAIALGTFPLIMVFPIPPALIDMGIISSLCISIFVLFLATTARTTIDFPQFPTILLTAIIFRLALNVSSTKLIVSDGHEGTASAGKIIESVSDFVMGSNIFVGFVVFFIILVVNFVVITKGSSRMAEVGARFALDGLPGKQMAIDSDLSSGAITHQEAAERRKSELSEVTFHGSLDGASKFVKGDAIAGLIIVMINLVGGLANGILNNGLSFSNAISTYAKLTVGDGIISQIPAVILSIAAALLISKNTPSTDGDSFFTVLKSRRIVILVLSAVCLALSFTPGSPTTILLLSALFLGALYFSLSGMLGGASAVNDDLENPTETEDHFVITEDSAFHVESLQVQFSTDILGEMMDPGTGLGPRVDNLRKFVTNEFGVLLPEILLSDSPSFTAGQYRIQVFGVTVGKGNVIKGNVMVLPSGPDITVNSAEVRDPVFGARAYWVPPSEQEKFSIQGETVVSCPEVVATHLLECVKQNLPRLFTLSALKRTLAEVSDIEPSGRTGFNRAIVEEIVPDKVPLEFLHTVLRLLLEERVSIRNFMLILEAVSEARSATVDTGQVVEAVRRRLAFQILAGLTREDGRLPLIKFGTEWEKTFAGPTSQLSASTDDLALSPQDIQRLVAQIKEQIEAVEQTGQRATFVTAAAHRRAISAILRANAIEVAVLSFDEILNTADPVLVGTVGSD